MCISDLLELNGGEGARAPSPAIESADLVVAYVENGLGVFSQELYEKPDFELVFAGHRLVPFVGLCDSDYVGVGYKFGGVGECSENPVGLGLAALVKFGDVQHLDRLVEPVDRRGDQNPVALVPEGSKGGLNVSGGWFAGGAVFLAVADYLVSEFGPVGCHCAVLS